MNRTLLMTAVAALAITAPAQAERGGKNKDETAQQAQQAETQKAQRGGGEQRVRAERPQRMERPQPQQRVQMERPQREMRVRMERPQREQRVQFQRPQREQRVQFQRPQRIERQRIVERAPRIERQRIERVRPLRIERQRVERVRPRHIERQQVERQRFDRRPAIERPAFRAQDTDRFATQRLSRQQERQAQRLARTQDRFAQRLDRRQNRLESLAQRRALIADSRSFQPTRSLGERLNLREHTVNRDWYDNVATQRFSTAYGASPNYFYDYDYDDGYLYQVDRNSNLVSAMFPLLGGAFSTGRMLPYGYDSYNVPYAYRSLYYDTPDYFYRYGDGGIYQVDSDTLMIQAVVALLTGQSLGIGQRLPLGYDVYNVPYAYRSTYFDTDDMWYRYDDGYIYGIDPYSRMIEQMYPVSYGGYAVGYPVPAYGSYGAYAAYPSYVPYDYQNLYYAAPGYNYQYANYGIYQVDPATQLISALVALVSGSNFGIGQTLPLGYDAYNVPYAYRSSYSDTPNTIYRYDDGYIYGANPHTRVIETMVPVTYNGFAVGYPVPADYPGYAVPPLYSDLYYAQPGYDYRYANGGIYQIDPQTRIVEAIAALLTGQTFGVGQMLPAGYDAYNVPYAYRSQYFDTADNWYRYADGNIYQVDPRSRVIQTVISVA